MARMLKRWESPRREGRNHKGKGGSARQRQLKKQTQMLRKKLQEGSEPEGNQGENKFQFSPFFLTRNYKLLTLSKIRLEFNSQHF